LLLIRYIRRHPFSVMALCNIVGDLGYLGFAFEALGWVSWPKLLGATFTMAAHVVLLAHGDVQAQHIAHESGAIARAVLALRVIAQRLLQPLPESLRRFARAKPIGVPFSMLCLNGVGLTVDALNAPFSLAMLAQIAVGLCIVLGCGTFALADFVPRQKTANVLLKIAPSILVGCSVATVGLVVTTGNPFITLSFFVFLLSNLAGFYTKIDKQEPISAGI
jgi:hypothetical protein